MGLSGVAFGIAAILLVLLVAPWGLNVDSWDLFVMLSFAVGLFWLANESLTRAAVRMYDSERSNQRKEA